MILNVLRELSALFVLSDAEYLVVLAIACAVFTSLWYSSKTNELLFI